MVIKTVVLIRASGGQILEAGSVMIRIFSFPASENRKDDSSGLVNMWSESV